jgi:hypothetical protein
MAHAILEFAMAVKAMDVMKAEPMTVRFPWWFSVL